MRAATRMMRVQFFDADIAVTGGSTADVEVTTQVTTRDGSGEDLAAAYTVSMALVRVDGRWAVARARIRSGGAAAP
jgi:hypothetical protein